MLNNIICITDKKENVSTAIKLCSVEDLKEWVHGPCKSNDRLKKAYPVLLSLLKSIENTSLNADTQRGLIGVLSLVKAATNGN